MKQALSNKESSARKFQSKLRQEEKSIVLEGKYDALIAEHSQLEHIKDFTDKLNDIYDHTDLKSGQLIKELVNAYNQSKSVGIHPSDLTGVQNLLKQNISFPLTYRAPLTMAEALRDNKMQKEMMEFMAKMEQIKK